MNIFRRTIVGACATLIPIFLFCIALIWSSSQVLGTPAPLKDALRQSGIYGSFVGSALVGSASAAISQIPISDPAVKKIIQDSFPPAYIEKQTESVINGFYDWAQGTTGSLMLTIDYSEPAQKLITGFTGYADQRLAKLPQCATLAEATAQTGKNPLNISCLPPNFDRAAAVENVRTALTAKDSPLAKTQFNGNELKGSDGRPLEQTLGFVPEAYNQARTFFIVACVFTLLLIAAIILAASTKRQGLKVASIAVLSTGIMTSAAALITAAVTNKLANNAAVSTENDKLAMAGYVTKVLQTMIGDVRNWWLGCGIVMVVIPAAILITLFIMKKREQRHDEVHGEVDFRSALHKDREEGGSDGDKPVSPPTTAL